MTREEMVEQVERDRRRREDALLLLLLALDRRSLRNVRRAIRVGADWRPLLAGTLMGDESLDLPGGVNLLAAVMADSHAAGVRRVGLLTGTETNAAASRGELVRQYRRRAADALERIRGALADAIQKALAEAAEADRISADVAAVGEAFAAAGHTPDQPHGAEAEATAAVTQAYAAGMGEGFGSSNVQAVMTGLAFVNPLDEKTTQICRRRHGVKLPLDHPWWFGNWPPLHWVCRSIVLPLTREVEFTADPPTLPPPDEGWGQWAGFLSAFQPVPA